MFREIHGNPPGLEAPTFPGVQPDEMEGFLRGIDAGVFSITDDGRFDSECMPRVKSGRVHKHELFCTGKELGRSHPEGVSQFAAGSDLHTRYGWPLGRIEIETQGRELDLLVRLADRDRTPLIGGEVKTTIRAIEKVLTEVSSCKAVKGCLHNDHKTLKALLQFRPRYFWAVAPAMRELHEVTYPDDGLSLCRVDDEALNASSHDSR